MTKRVSINVIRNMITTFNEYHKTTLNGRPHKMVLDTGNINGLGLAWMDMENKSYSAHISTSTAMTHWETYLVIKAMTDHQIYVEQSKLTIERV